jgi:2-polyprenyl-3-methyl-5-hydroxy-6-metoxy-1,4-benzoquinol methylase
MSSPDAPAAGVYPKDFEEAERRHARHFARYFLALPYARGAVAVDAACGSGYGSAWLAQVAESVLGLDIDEQRLAWARQHHQPANVRYALHDLHKPLPVERPLTLVTSFETLEHVDAPPVCLKNLADALADDGVALISVPNGTMELRGGQPKPYHRWQFSSADFEKLLRGCFADVHPHAQVYGGGLGHYLAKWLRGQKRQARAYRFLPGLRDDAKTWLAVCRAPKR